MFLWTPIPWELFISYKENKTEIMFTGHCCSINTGKVLQCQAVQNVTIQAFSSRPIDTDSVWIWASRCNRESVAIVQGSALAPTWRCCTCASCLFSWREAEREPRPPTVSRLVSPTIHGLLTKVEYTEQNTALFCLYSWQGCGRLLLSSQSNTNRLAPRFVVAINSQSEITISIPQ